MNDKNKELLHNCERFANENVIQCAKELVQLKNTGILPEGKLRELARMLKPIVNTDSIGFAKMLVVNSCLEHVSMTNTNYID